MLCVIIRIEAILMIMHDIYFEYDSSRPKSS